MTRSSIIMAAVDHRGQIYDQCKYVGIRWAFDVGAWKPSKEQWLRASTLVQSEELERIRRFVYTKDSKASIVGRLLMHKMAVDVLGLRYPILRFARTDNGKPYLVFDGSSEKPLDGAPALSFNVSHQGSYCVLAAEVDRPVGVDVTKMIYEGGKPVPEFFRLMRRQFTPQEWISIIRPPNVTERLRLFYRHWALKESYVKALGVGIGFDLERVGFRVKSDLLSRDPIVTDTTLEVDRSPVTNWTFEESLLDDNHCVAVALGTSVVEGCSGETSRPARHFQLLNFDDVVCNLEPLRPYEASVWTEFVAKQESPS